MIPQFSGSLWTLGALIYLALGAFIVMNFKSTHKYYHRKWRSDETPQPVLTALVVCIVLWPLLLARKDVDF